MLTSARASGNSSYDPRTAITFYYNQGRNEIAANSFIVPYTTALLQSTLASFNAKLNSEFFGSLSSSSGEMSQQALAAIAQAPQTVSQPFFYEAVNLRPYTKTASQAVLLVGQIYISESFDAGSCLPTGALTKIKQQSSSPSSSP